MSNNRILRFAVLIDGFSVKKWQYESLQMLLDDGNAALVCFIKNSGGSAYRANKHSWGFRYLERRIRNTGPLDSKDIKAEFKNTELLEMSPNIQGVNHFFLQQDIERIKALELDFMLRFGFGIIKGEILELPKFGIWSFHHGDPRKYRGGPPAFWEIMNGEGVSGAILQQLNEKLDAGKVLQQGYLKTIAHNYKDQVYQLLNVSRNWPVQVVRSIVLNNDQLHGEAIHASAPIYKTPSNAKTILFLLVEFFNKIKFHYQDLFHADKWNIGVIPEPIESLIEDKQKEVNWLKEKNRNSYLADPFADPDQPGHIFCEEYQYKNQKGTIVQVDQSGNQKKNLFQENHHLSYPYTLSVDDRSYIIPESFEDNKISAYIKHNGLFNKKKIMVGRWIDPTLIYDGDLWWLFCTEKKRPNEQLFLFYSKSLDQEFQAHPLNPVITDICSARPAGTPFFKEGYWYRPGQNCSKTYGGSIQIKKIEKMSPTDYKESLVKEINPLKGKYDKGIHTLSSYGDKTLVDGKRLYFNYWHFKNQLLAKLKRTLKA